MTSLRRRSYLEANFSSGGQRITELANSGRIDSVGVIRRQAAPVRGVRHAELLGVVAGAVEAPVLGRVDRALDVEASGAGALGRPAAVNEAAEARGLAHERAGALDLLRSGDLGDAGHGHAVGAQARLHGVLVAGVGGGRG